MNAARPLPAAFRAPRLLRGLNVLAVGFALAAAAGAISGLASHDLVFSCSVSTLFFGLVWTRGVRIRRGKVPLGWLASVPLAALNAGTAFSVLVFLHPAYRWGHLPATPFASGVSLGAGIWAPALLFTLAIFGLPLHRAQRAAQRGLTNDDRGERAVGERAAGVAAVALVAAPFVTRTVGECTWLVAMGASGVAAGLSAASYATRRERSRHLFLAEVERGAIDEYRIDAVDPGFSLLVRIRGADNGDYRTPRLVEPLVELDRLGQAKRTLTPP